MTCCQTLYWLTPTTPSNALWRLHTAPTEAHYDAVLKYIVENAAWVVNDPSFLELATEETLLILIRLDTLAIREIDLFNAIVRWGCTRLQKQSNPQLREETPENIRREIAALIPYIRFNVVQDHEVAKFVTGSGVVTSEELLNILLVKAIRMVVVQQQLQNRNSVSSSGSSYLNGNKVLFDSDAMLFASIFTNEDPLCSPCPAEHTRFVTFGGAGGATEMVRDLSQVKISNEARSIETVAIFNDKLREGLFLKYETLRTRFYENDEAAKEREKCYFYWSCSNLLCIPICILPLFFVLATLYAEEYAGQWSPYVVVAPLMYMLGCLGLDCIGNLCCCLEAVYIDKNEDYEYCFDNEVFDPKTSHPCYRHLLYVNIMIAGR